ncbi:MAG: acetate--CoA ligase family protein [Planctomycetota bacterium]
MECIKSVTLTGANRWAGMSVLEVYVDCGDRRVWETFGETTPRSRLRLLVTRLDRLARDASRLARQEETRGVSLGRRLLAGLDSRLPLPDILRLLTQLLQATAGLSLPEGWTAETDEPRVYLLALPIETACLGAASLEAALELCRASLSGEEIDAAVVCRRLVDLADDVRLGPSSRAIVKAASERGVMYRRLNTGSLVQLGEGARQRRIWTAETDATSAIAESIAQDKELTKRLLRAVGVPVPFGRPVTDAEDAWKAACDIGFPVVVKPRRANHARGISLNLTTRDQVLAAFDWAVKDGDNTGVMVEQYALGQAHRLLVVGQRLIAAARGESEFVTGDGRSTIRELVEQVNRDPRRGENYTDQLTLLKLDDAALLELGKQGLDADAVPVAGRRVLIQAVGDLTTDCTADVHPANAAKAVLAARVIGLDIAGLDVVAQDIREPLEDQRGAILEVNAGPSLAMHVAPLHGRPQPVGSAIVDLLYPAGASSRIPLVAVGGNGRRPRIAFALAELLADFHAESHRGVGLGTTEGLFVDGARLASPRSTDRDQLEALLLHPVIECAIWESRPDEAARSGLGYERFDIAVVSDLPGSPRSDDSDDGEHVAGESAQELRDGCLALAHAVPPTGHLVLPWDSPLARPLARATRGARVFFGESLSPESIATAIRGGGWLVTTRVEHDGLNDSNNVLAGDLNHPANGDQSAAAVRVVFARSEGCEEGWAPLDRDDGLTLGERLAVWAAAWAAGMTLETILKTIIDKGKLRCPQR